MEKWMGIREFSRLEHCTHGAIQRAVRSGRIPESCVRRDPQGRLIEIEAHAAARAWGSNTVPRADRVATAGLVAARALAAQQGPQSGGEFDVKSVQVLLGSVFANSLLPCAALSVFRGINPAQALATTEDLMFLVASVAAGELGADLDGFGLPFSGDMLETLTGATRPQLLARIEAAAKTFTTEGEDHEHGTNQN